MFLDEELVEAIPAIHGSGGAVESSDVAIGDMISKLEKGYVGLWFVPEKPSPPDPGFPYGHFSRSDNAAVEVVDLKVILSEAVELSFLARPRGLGSLQEGEKS